MTNSTKNLKFGFSLVEIVLAVGLVSVISTIVLVSVNPFKKMAEARNTQRRSDVKAIMDAINQYAINHKGVFSPLDKQNNREICKANISEQECEMAGGMYLGELSTGKIYITSIPEDPLGGGCELNEKIGTCYIASKNETDQRVTISAPKSELGEIIEIIN